MAEEDILEEEQQPVDVEVEEPTDEPVAQETKNQEDSFYKNLAEDMDDRALSSLSSDLISEFKKDKESRSDWEKGYISGLDLLGFKYSDAGQPFKGASGVTHPLLSEAVTQFQAQAYKELLPSDGPVRTQVVGDTTKMKEEQASRVKEFMNYMVMDKMEEYTPEFDQLLFYLPLAGSSFKKIYYDEVRQRAVSKFVPAEDLVVPYYATDLMDCERITHIIKMTENDVLKKQKTGFYKDVELLPTQEEDEVQSKYDEIEGVSDQGPRDYQFNVLEMHVDLDLDEYEKDNNEKNVKVPYIVTIDEGSQEILSIYRNFSPDDETLRRNEYFVPVSYTHLTLPTICSV